MGKKKKNVMGGVEESNAWRVSYKRAYCCHARGVMRTCAKQVGATSKHACVSPPLLTAVVKKKALSRVMHASEGFTTECYQSDLHRTRRVHVSNHMRCDYARENRVHP